MSESTPPTPPTYKDTLNLPKTAFDMKANLTQREPKMVAQWAKDNLYQQIRAARKNSPKGRWILHDGPPYANGDIHMGHLINKVLKDIVIKFRTMQGYDSPYVPGWDCHGLPIESAIQKELGPGFRGLSKDEVRKRCHDYAMKYVKLQGDSFQRFGILGEFAKPYLTMDPAYESGILEVLAELVHRDLIYRQKKPVHWCTNDRTALAEAELEYANRKDHSVFVNFELTNIDQWMPPEWLGPIQRDQAAFSKTGTQVMVCLMIWTTTPWTLPANRAVAVNEKANYVLCHYAFEDKWVYTIVAEETLSRLGKFDWHAGRRPFQISNRGGSKFSQVAVPPITGKALAERHARYLHPFHRDNRPGDPVLVQPVVLANYVTLEDGTGLVHTAPGHGKEDYQTGIKYGLEVYNPVLADGRYDDTVPEFLRGQTIWDANQLVIDKLKETGALFHHQEFAHEYPHCWRCKKPVIFRATEQWFVKASGSEADIGSEGRHMSSSAREGRESDTPTQGAPEGRHSSPLWTSAKQFVNKVKWIPAWGQNRIDGMLDTRPDWCISRQRSWGVPIPAFFDEAGNVLLTEKSVRRIADYFRQHGADSWYTHTPAQLLGADTWTDAIITPDGKTLSAFSLQTSALTKGADILDVWFESGASHHAVLGCTNPELGYPADMYLEGSDQHRGWFQSTLLEAAGYKPVPPFKEVLTHGFVVDEKGGKMSKSLGNDTKVDAALKQYGADVLRLWVSSVDYQNDIPCGPHLLAKTAEAYRKIRNTMRYLLGNLYDFNPTTDSTPPRPHSIDAWMQSKVDAWSANIHAAYDRYEFHNVFKLLYEFCNVEISAIYAKAIKDRLYCELPNSPKRRASQTVCHRALLTLIELSAPVLAFTAEEAWQALRQLPGCDKFEPSVHLHPFSAFSLQPSAFVDAHWSVLLPLIEKGNKQLDDLKRTIGLGNPLDAEAVIILPKVADEVSALITDYGPEIEDALGVGFHRIEHGEDGGGWDIKVNDTRNLYPSCARSWKRRPDVGSDKDYPDLSARDAAVVRALRTK